MSPHLSDHDTAGTVTQWGVFSFSKGLEHHVVDEHGDRAHALAARDLIRKSIDAWALLVHREVVTGKWTPDTTHEVTS